MLLRLCLRLSSFSKHTPQQTFKCYSSMEDLLKPPACVYQMKKLDKTQFTKVIQVPVLHIKNIKISEVLPLVKKLLLKVEKFKSICRTDSGIVQVYLNPMLVTQWADLPQESKEGLETLKLTDANLKIEDFTISYDNFGAGAILRAVLPKDQDGFSSYTVMGRIVHVTLKDHLLPYKDIIGEVLYEKVKGCESVVNKVNNIDNTYRNFEMEVLKGSDNMLTTVKENNCRFEFDFSTVYWNSRLCTEHERIVNILQPGDVLFDVFAGVGPFAIPAAKKKCLVFANDLNPESYKWLQHNKKLNKVSDEYFQGFNLEGREFILNIIKENLPTFLGKKNIFFIMNLPALAVEFLDAYVGLLKDCQTIPESFTSVTVYVYCFAKGENPEQIAKMLIESNLKVADLDINSVIKEIFRVRTVSNFKEMIRVTLHLDKGLLAGAVDSKRKQVDEAGVNKRLCVGKNGQDQEEKQQRVYDCGS